MNESGRIECDREINVKGPSTSLSIVIERVRERERIKVLIIILIEFFLLKTAFQLAEINIRRGKAQKIRMYSK